MAQVFLARDEVLERDVAVKVLREQYAENEEFVERFRREALNVASLSHPNIVQVFDRIAAEDGRYYIAMEYVPGGTLKRRIRRDGPLSPRTAVAVAVQIASALEAAHGRGVIHRDVKPQNVLITASGDVKVADFGIARAASADVLSGTSAVLGTASYMSPEQALSKSVGPASDLYSLGVVLYEMLTGHVPFKADTPVAISMKHVSEPPRPPRELNKKVPERLNALVLDLLAKNPEDRPANAATLVADLDRSLRAGPAATTGAKTGTPMAAPVPDVPGGGSEDGPRRRTPRVLAVLALLALLGAFGWGAVARPGGGEIVGALEGVPDRIRMGADKAQSAIAAPAEVEVPDVEGLTENAARERLIAAGLGMVVEKRRSYEESAGRVLEQSVPEGEKVEKGSRLLLAVSSGPGDDERQTSIPAFASTPSAADASGDAGPGGADDSAGSGGSGNDQGSSADTPEPAPNAASTGDEDEQNEAPAPTEEAQPQATPPQATEAPAPTEETQPQATPPQATPPQATPPQDAEQALPPVPPAQETVPPLEPPSLEVVEVEDEVPPLEQPQSYYGPADDEPDENAAEDQY